MRRFVAIMDTARMQTGAGKFCQLLLQPVVSILLKAGIPYRVFAEIAKTVYVDVASRDFGIRGRPTNVSRVAVMTGLSRREVTHQRNLVENPVPAAPDKLRSAARVLMGWHTDDAFLNSEGQPRVLAETGEADSFHVLYRRFGSADIPEKTVLNEFLRIGAVRRTAERKLQVLTRYYMPEPTDPQALERAGSVLHDLGSTVAHNLTRTGDAVSRLEGRATSVLIPAKAEAAFREYMQIRGQAFLEEIDDWLMRNESREKGKPLIRMGAGVYEIR